jgi:hypothetical protein
MPNAFWRVVLPLFVRSQEGESMCLSALIIYNWLYYLTWGYHRPTVLISDGELAKVAGFSRRQTWAMLSRLEAIGLIKVSRRVGSRTHTIRVFCIADLPDADRARSRLIYEIVSRSSQLPENERSEAGVTARSQLSNADLINARQVTRKEGATAGKRKDETPQNTKEAPPH